MARGSIPIDGLVIDFDEPPRKFEHATICIDLELYSEEAQGAKFEGDQDYRVVKAISNEEQCSFDQFLIDFLKERNTHDSFRPIPPMIGDGQPVDLKTLFLIVIGKGGYDAVSKNYLWDLVAEKSGLGVNIGSSSKLIYWKYLATLEIWLIKVSEGRVLGYSLIDDDGINFGSQLMELQAEIKRLLSDYIAPDTSGDNCKVQDGLDMPRKLYNIDETMKMIAKKLINALDAGNSSNNNEENNVTSLSNEDGVKEFDNDDNDVLILDPSSVNKDNFGRKRKRKSSMQELLCWVTSIAKNPCDPTVCSILDRSKWSSQSNEEIQKQVLLFRREAVLMKRNVESSKHHDDLGGMKMHPSMYDDDHPGRTCILKEGMKCGECNRTLPVPNEKLVPLVPLELLEPEFDLELEPEPDSSKIPVAIEPDSNINTKNQHTKDVAKKSLLLAKCTTVPIPIGPTHQASVPEWTGVTFESDPKWLGAQIWPLKSANQRHVIEERDIIGKGRDEFCNCQVRGSVECVKFHIAENRAKLKLELDEAFYQWNFNKAGEEVSHYWTYDEEKKFIDVLKSNVSSPKKCLWDHIFRSFPNKSRQDLVNYYFNVIVLRRRRFQNRQSPNNIDSDDDELELEPLIKAKASGLVAMKKKATGYRGRSRK